MFIIYKTEMSYNNFYYFPLIENLEITYMLIYY